MREVEYQCQSCDRLFQRPVWHCEGCGHHHGADRDTCNNCYRARSRSPLSRPLTAADAERWLTFWMLRHAGPNDLAKLAKYARAARPSQLGKFVVKQVLFLEDRERKQEEESQRLNGQGRTDNQVWSCLFVPIALASQPVRGFSRASHSIAWSIASRRGYSFRVHGQPG